MTIRANYLDAAIAQAEAAAEAAKSYGLRSIRYEMAVKALRELKHKRMRRDLRKRKRRAA